MKYRLFVCKENLIVSDTKHATKLTIKWLSKLQQFCREEPAKL